ncbi:MAG TPA: PEP-CTERM sorting domain-containing protein [Myxococcota bacterium]|nr:PEP-CTERM sorting domain-containing protein [Myxococcota bacterium]
MQAPCRFAAIALVLGLAGLGRADSLSVTGPDGAAGANGLDSPPAPQATDGQPGGAGGDATAAAGGNPDASNDATAIGGNGGAGGLAGSSAAPPFASPGAGGAGGAANATADTSIHFGAASATSLATGGNGAASAAAGGDGGSASAQSTAVNDGGPASASATATGGAGGAGSAGSEIGGQGDSTATAHGLGDTTAVAHAAGGNIPSQANGGYVTSASASATSDSGNAAAMAEASGSPGYYGAFGDAQAFANAPHGDATAIARSIGGSGAYGGGASFAFTQGASGSASGRLTLIQEAIGGDSSQFFDPSQGFYQVDSTLNAQNSGGGPLTGYATARGSDSVVQAFATGSSPFGAQTDMHSLAIGSAQSHPAPCAPGLSCGVILDPGFAAFATTDVGGPATTDLLGTAVATGTNSVTQFASTRLSLYNVESLRSYVQLDGPAYTGAIVSSPADVTLSLDTAVAANETATRVDLGAFPRGAETRSYLQVRPSDVADWTAGSPNTGAALANGARVLALSSLGFASDAPGVVTYNAATELDFTLSGSGPESISLAFLDPKSLGGIDGLHLRLERDGTTVLLDESFTSAAEIAAALDDRLVKLADAFAPGVATTLTLLLDVTLAPGSVESSKLGLDLAFLVPEPSVALLVLGALAGLAIRRRA